MDVKNINIWKNDDSVNANHEDYLNTDISELNLSVRSFNCLKRANCNTVQEVLDYMGEDGEGLRRIRNLGNRSEAEIKERIRDYREEFPTQANRSIK